MDAHDELFYRMNDPDPKVRAWAELQLIGQIFGLQLCGAVARVERL
jgi:hypothetical protein